ncbi:MAG: 16S rRNA (cytosine(1402)-N(4))-methyltransferase RsmH [Desulfobulbaceae bacterium]|nr:16S rRNA (cytosine(1402)-N(4))-methyltransferase RsmH [Desulfobulbaceae bacterium]
MKHVPVLLRETMEWLRPVAGGIYVDGNLGLGGHAEAILAASGPDGRLVAFDWDEEALAAARQRLSGYGDRLIALPRNFTTLAESLAELGIGAVDGILLDLGVSSLQLDQPERGFSFRNGGPLDMRMDSRQGETAADLLNGESEENLADIFYNFGEERQARRIAAAVVEFRVREPLVTTDQLATLVERAIPRKFHPRDIHVATKVFQALRIAVNHELDNLVRVLELGSQLLKEDGRFCVISFHSLEDRLVKRAFLAAPRLRVLTRKPIRPTEEECRENSRSRSARLRVSAATPA